MSKKKNKKEEGPKFRVMPHIIGAKFQEDEHNIEKYEEMIKAAPNIGRPIRVLFSTEASYLRTGFSTYLREVFTRLNKTGRFELAELGCFTDKSNHDVLMGDFTEKDIKEVLPDDLVITHKGRAKKVNRVQERYANETVVKIFSEHFGGTIEVTKNHPIYIIKNDRKDNRIRKNKNKSPQWIPAEEISVGDFIAHSIPQQRKAKKTFEINGSTFEYSSDLALIFGWYLAEGWIDEKRIGTPRVYFCGNIREKNILEKIGKAIKNIFRIDYNWDLSKEKSENCSQIYVRSENFAEIIRQCCSKYAHKKRIGSFIKNAPKSFVLRLVAAWAEGNGSHKDNSYNIKTVSKKLSDQVCLLCYSVGVFPSHKNSVVKFHGLHAKSINQYMINKKHKYRKCNRRKYFIKDGILFSRVSQISKRKYKGIVYNLEVDEDSSYIVNGKIVHNSYGAPREGDKRAAQVPWKYYHNLPTNPMEEQAYGTKNGQPINDNYRENQFGKWKLPYVLADFKPDIVLLNRDNWMDTHVLQCPLRDKVLVYWMPTVDGYPQKWEWLKDYAQVDGLFAYSHFGKKVLEEQSKTVLSKRLHKLPELKVLDVIQPGVNLDIFKPMDKVELKRNMGIPANMRFVGTVMRNQPRKLFPRIIDAFYMFKTRYPQSSKNVKLLLHTSIPDVGWDIPEAVLRRGLENEVLFSYVCRSCGSFTIMNFRGSPTICPACNQKTLYTPNTQFGVDEDKFAMIYNLMDVYIQGSIAEGDGMPVNEAKACGIPCLVSDYSALYEKGRNGGAMPIVSETIYTEHETMQWRSLFSRKDLAHKLNVLMTNDQKRAKLSRRARECAERFYNWDLTAKKWEAWILNAPLKDRKETWEAPIELKTPEKSSPPSDLSNEDFIEWLYINILRRNGVDPGGLQYWIGLLQQGASRKDMEKHFRTLVERENTVKELIQNPNKGATNPMDRVRDIVERTEGKI